MSNEIVTTDLQAFGYRELKLAAKLLTAWTTSNMLNADIGDGVSLNFNTHSGCVFLSDEDCRCFMMNGDSLEEWFYTPYEGHEGFADKLREMHENGNINHPEDIEYLQDAGIIEKPEEEE